MVSNRVAPAEVSRSATSRAEIGSRPRNFFSCLEYGKYGATTVMRAAEARRAASSMTRSSITRSFTLRPKDWKMKTSRPRTCSRSWTRISPLVQVETTASPTAVPICCATRSDSCRHPLPEKMSRFARPSSIVVPPQSVVQPLGSAFAPGVAVVYHTGGGGMPRGQCNVFATPLPRRDRPQPSAIYAPVWQPTAPSRME